MGSELDKPLGRSLARPTDGRQPVRRKRPQVAGLLTACAAVLALAGGGAWVSFSGSRIETAGSIVTGSVPEPGASAAATVQTDPGIEPESADIEEIRNDEPGGTEIAILDGRSGGNFETVDTDDGQSVTIVTPGERTAPGGVVIAPADRRGQDARLAHLPEPDLIETATAGPLPIRAANGRRPYDAYARPWSGARGARVTIIVGGLGLSQTGTQYAIRNLPADVTLAFAANGNSLARWMQEARRDGHEILLQVPFEPFNYPANNPGPGTLTVAAGADANLESLHEAMAKLTNYTGITNFMGGRFLSEAEALEPVMREIADRGLMFVDDGTSAQSLTDEYAKALGMPFAASDMVLDSTQERGDILKRLDELERIARRNGQATGVASAFGVSVDAIATWVEEASARGIEIVAASAAAEDPERQAGR